MKLVAVQAAVPPLLELELELLDELDEELDEELEDELDEEPLEEEDELEDEELLPPELLDEDGLELPAPALLLSELPPPPPPPQALSRHRQKAASAAVFRIMAIPRLICCVSQPRWDVIVR